jgi:hypothetical protein
MAYNKLESFLGKVVPDGQCVALVKAACGCPQTALWKRGALVKGIPLAYGTAIATFDPPSAEHPEGLYGNHTDGRSHAAVYLGQDVVGIQVMDQWLGQPVHKRTLRFRGGEPGVKDVNNGDKFYVVE